jgi:hypothetical protein
LHNSFRNNQCGADSDTLRWRTPPKNWSVISGINNPIASVSTVTATDPVTRRTITIPANQPVVGPAQDWYSGRVYAPRAAPGTTSNSTTAAWSNDIGSYRTIGQVQLSTGDRVTIP